MTANRPLVILTILLMTSAFTAHADTIWDESVDGPLSTSGASPTQLTLVSSADQVFGEGGGGVNSFTFNVPAGKTVNSMMMDTVAVPGAVIIYDLYAGPDNTSPSWCAAQLVNSFPAEMLTPPACVSTLPAGDYTVVLTEISAIPWNVSIDSDVPVELQVFTVE